MPHRNISVHITNISFSYDAEKPVFKDFSLIISQPGVYCIQGPSGIGKSTLFSLLLKIHKIQDGKILINNRNLSSMNTAELRKTIGIVHQNIFLLDDTIMNNIIFGDSLISQEDVINISERIGFHKYISRLPKGYNTYVSNTGDCVSCGLKKLTTILRTLSRNPDILLLDEITSNVDSYTNMLIHKFLSDISSEKICLFITHKKSDYKSSYKLIEIQH